jgi:hypothetical protein
LHLSLLKKDAGFALMNRQTHSEHITSGISEAIHADIQELIEASSRYDGIDFPFALSELPSSTDNLPACAGYLKHLPKNGGFDLFSNLLFEYLSCE